MNEDIVEGGLRRGLGAAEHAIGEADGDLSMSLHGRVQELAGRVQSAYGQAKDHAAETMSGFDAFVTERPYLSAAIAAATGVALGFLLGLGRPKVIVIRPVTTPRA
jgi:uncharacterized protein YjbJ (UPF0337 family)